MTTQSSETALAVAKNPIDAVVPLATDAIADTTGSFALALILPAACYAIIAGFGFYARRPYHDAATK